MAKRTLFLSLFLLVQAFILPINAQDKSSSCAYQDHQARFTVITDGVIRMEWSPNGIFTDSPSFLAVNRTYTPVKYEVKNKGRWVEITTDKMKLKYEKNSGRFTETNLSVCSSPKLGTAFTWKPGMKQNNNLKGTYRTLDGYDGDHPQHNPTGNPMPIEEGLLATDGWTCLDDSKNFLFDHSAWPRVEARPQKEGQDLYFMAYGHNYKKALKDFTVFAGKVPLPPRYAFGYWWSRYWSYSDNELRNLVDKFHTYNIPLDVLVIDMDWHYTEKGKGGWTGYTWNKRLFPDPAGFLKYLKKNDLQITLNLHPADGIAPYEEKYPEMAKWMGVDPASQQTIPYTGSSKRFMSGWLNTVLKPMQDEGVDFWWLDWQQFPTDKEVEGLNNTWWINYAFFSNMEQNGTTRPLLYHRWGGLGNHRYQIGFSGDSFTSWNSLDFQPYFNSTASNVLYGYWSHDIGGHMGVDKIDPELFTRWMQFGALSPIMRTHSTKNAGMNKEPWVFSPVYFEVLRNTIMQRYQLAPYIYAMARKTYDDGISLCRPLYYDYPESKEAYSFRDEYMFGDNLLVAPITAPMKEGYSTLQVWLPAGNDWYEWQTGTLLKGGQTVERSFAIDEYPLYVKAGSVLPLYQNVNNLRHNNEKVAVTVFPGQQGSFTMYEDNGNDKQYATNYATTTLKSEQKANTLTVTIGAREGQYPDMPARRTFDVNIVASAMPQSVTVNGKQAEFRYDGNSLTLNIAIPETDCGEEKVVTVVYPTSATALTDGLVGQFRRIQKSVLDLKYRNAGIVLTEELGTMESAGRNITYHPAQLDSVVAAFHTHYSNLPQVLKGQKLDDDTQRWFLQTIDWKGNK